ncbi:MAG: hypothetical protein ACRDJH_20515 [Thermomicrobiales bacterium]
MASESNVIDIDKPVDLGDVVDDVRATNEPRILRRNGENVAVVTPIGPAVDHSPGRVKTPEDYEAFRRSAGGWKGLIDANTFVEEVYERR